MARMKFLRRGPLHRCNARDRLRENESRGASIAGVVNIDGKPGGRARSRWHACTAPMRLCVGMPGEMHFRPMTASCPFEIWHRLQLLLHPVRSARRNVQDQQFRLARKMDKCTYCQAGRVGGPGSVGNTRNTAPTGCSRAAVARRCARPNHCRRRRRDRTQIYKGA
jgi:hypothetical protein